MDMATADGNGMAAWMRSAWMQFLFAIFLHTLAISAVLAAGGVLTAAMVLTVPGPLVEIPRAAFWAVAVLSASAVALRMLTIGRLAAGGAAYRVLVVSPSIGFAMLGAGPNLSATFLSWQTVGEAPNADLLRVAGMAVAGAGLGSWALQDCAAADRWRD